MRIKRREIEKWQKFCKAKIERIEKVWNRKLEDPRESDSSDEPSVDNTFDDDEPSDDPFNFAPRGMSRSMVLNKDD